MVSTHDSVSPCNLFSPGQGRGRTLWCLQGSGSPPPLRSGVHATVALVSSTFLECTKQGPAPEPWTSFLLAETFLGLCPHILRSPLKCHHSSETCHYSQINSRPAPPNLLARLAFLYSISPTLSALPYSLLVFLHLNRSSLGQGLYPLPCCIFCVWTGA